MTDPIATLRRYTCPDPSYQQSITQALDALEAELTALRENALDLSRVPEGLAFFRLTRIRTGHCEIELIPTAEPWTVRRGFGPTPRAALDAAIARANEQGQTK